MPEQETRVQVDCVAENMGFPDSYIPRPSEVRIEYDSVVGGFGKSEVEETAGRLVLFMVEEKNDLWSKFELCELEKYYLKKGWNPSRMLDGLTGAWVDMGDFMLKIYETEIFIVNLLGLGYCVTREFIKRCKLK